MGSTLAFLSAFLVTICCINHASGQWWKESVVYQIYPRSFKDTDGDGIGDLKGITEELDYIKSLGVKAVWISPFFKSPGKDFGYDISDFRDIDPLFGTMADFQVMSAEFKKQGLYLIVDMVPNHSSDQHVWFNKSVAREEPFTDYYVWKDSKGNDTSGNPIPPNNWVSVFGGSAWEWNDQRQQFYLHQFVKEQPDLNYENPAVRNEMLSVFKYWLDAGVDGFRVDAVPHMYEDQRYLDEPANPDADPNAKPTEHGYWLHPYTFNLPGVLDFLADVRALLDIYTGVDGRVRCMMVEATVSDDDIMNYYGTSDRPIAHFPFNFHLLGVRPEMKANNVSALIDFWYDKLPAGEWATVLIGNHDNKRAATRWTEANIDGANMINLLIQGTPVTYYGEEIGMLDKYLTWEETVDPSGCNAGEDRYDVFSRDPARTPMQWNTMRNAGFSDTTDKTWLPVHENYLTINVVAQLIAPPTVTTHLRVYKDLVKIRSTNAWKSSFTSENTINLNNNEVLGIKLVDDANPDSWFLALISFSDANQTVNAIAIAGVKPEATVLIKSVGYVPADLAVGGTIATSAILLGPRNSIVVGSCDILNMC